jgi:hypothetical protein
LGTRSFDAVAGAQSGGAKENLSAFRLFGLQPLGDRRNLCAIFSSFSLDFSGILGYNIQIIVLPIFCGYQFPKILTIQEVFFYVDFQ